MFVVFGFPLASRLVFILLIYACSSRTCEKQCHILIGWLFVNLRVTHDPCLGKQEGILYAHASIWAVEVPQRPSSVNWLRSVPAFAGCFLELNDVYWVLRSTNMFFKVSRYFYDESEFIVASLSPLRGQSFLS